MTNAQDPTPVINADDKGQARSEALLEVRDLNVVFRTRSGPLSAVSGVDFTLAKGKTLALVGESGSGKSTIAKAILGLIPQKEGNVTLNSEPLPAKREQRSRAQNSVMQMVFQDPVSSLNPRRRLSDIVAEPAAIRGLPKVDRVEIAERMLRAVGLDPQQYGRRTPRQISGGQAQRVAIARALAAEPEILVADEPVSGLDVSVQATVLNVLGKLSRESGVSMLFISHDMAVVRAISDDIAVLYLGRVCETGPTEEVIAAPAHPYTAALMAAVPQAGREMSDFGVKDVEPPSPLSPPPGCAFSTRCPLATERCVQERPVPVTVGVNRTVACHYPLVAAGQAAAGQVAAKQVSEDV